jgi:SSS family solute:Na+ symporter
LIIIGIYYWTTNQSMVQRTLGAKNIDQGRWGALFAGLLKLPILWLMIFPGVFAILLFPDLSNPDDAFPRLMAELLPVGIKGVMMAALVAAITSSVDSIMNSAGTLVTMDFVRPAYPNMPEERVVRIGRWSTSVVMILAIAWAPMITMFPSLWDYLQAVLSYMAPPIVVLFLTGIFWQGASRRAANLTLSVGLAGGLIGFVAGEVYDAYSMHFLYAALVSFLVSGALLVVLSHVWPDTSGKDAPDLIWTKKVWQEESASLVGVAWWKNYRLQALVLAVLTLSIVYYYR